MSLRDVLPQTWTERDGRGSIGGVDLGAIAERFGTPAYVFDEVHLEKRLEEWSTALGPGVTPVYATKAFLCTALAGMISRTGWWVDVVSAGEAAVARCGGVSPSNTLLHGNLKTDPEIELAANGVVAVTVIDSLGEIDRLAAAAGRTGRIVDVMIRLNEPVDLVTDRKVLTTGADAKFGLAPDLVDRAIDRIAKTTNLRLRGVHLHAGSHITDPDLFGVILERLATVVARRRSAFDTSPVLLDVGGGLAAPYLRTDPVVAPAAVGDAIRETLVKGSIERRIGPVQVMVEPGRALVANAGVLLYTVGVRKPLPGGGELLALDGGLTDNPRPALYGSRYELLAVDRLDQTCDHQYRVFGRMCESDLLLDSVGLPGAMSEGDLVVMPTAGAYTFSMSSRYNAFPRPPVLFVRDGQVREVVPREIIEDLLRGQRTLDEARPWSCNVSGILG